ncbi:hypothetical protein EJV47_03110 [Hymenobacter gummosus]|uniref:Uncharacterized protein n=1 Tax=Hymenobacter gummosus TaxID=1776032 RepID=A0A431U9G1_9BACT|nr:hypothetical protein [Hymenobacter gummosus]RTQ53737.1 hypothetical protein EJV47_03110 [Hymenobacter gummosus]
MSSFSMGQAVRLKDQPTAEVRQIMLINPADAKPIKCAPLPALLAMEDQAQFMDFEEYAPHELEPASPGSYTLPNPRKEALEAMHAAMQGFLKYVPENDQPGALVAVVREFMADPRVDPTAYTWLNEAMRKVIHQRTGYAQASVNEWKEYPRV